MKYIIISDVHANMQAFEAVISSFPEKKDHRIVHAGDIVGYGADPNACVDLLKSLEADSVIGNHDAAAIGRTGLEKFNSHAVEAMHWTREELTMPACKYLATLPYVHEEDNFKVVHGTLHDPEEFKYMLTGSDAMRTFQILDKKICFVGHSHIPGIFILRKDKVYEMSKSEIILEKEAKYIVNVGSIGQPRDNDNRACYCVYDQDNNRISFNRVEYNVTEASDRIIRSGLPRVLADRLLYGR